MHGTTDQPPQRMSIEEFARLPEDPPTVRAPDLAFVAEGRLPPGRSPLSFPRFAPDLAVEVVSPSDRGPQVSSKVRDYLEGGTRMVWVVDSRSRSITVHRPGAAPEVVDESGILDAGDVLPGFRTTPGRFFREG